MSVHPSDVSVSRLRRVTHTAFVASGAFAIAIALALAATGGTFAYFSGSAQLSAGTITAGTATLKVNGVDSYTVTGLDASKLTPGASVITSTPLTVSNTGDTPLAVSSGAVTFSTTGSLANHLTVSLHRVTTSSCTVGSGADLGTAYTLAKGTTMNVCLTVTLASTAPVTVAGQSATFTVSLDGMQVRS